MFSYNTKGTCSRLIVFDVDENDNIHNVKFIGGCSGNLQGISCPDQLSHAIEAYKMRDKAAVKQ